MLSPAAKYFRQAILTLIGKRIEHDQGRALVEGVIDPVDELLKFVTGNRTA
ncbi:Uncharacterised protein [Klebsiella pneumoniae]|nr:Uncharacterised protein [Klebsiella pneumoniae]